MIWGVTSLYTRGCLTLIDDMEGDLSLYNPYGIYAPIITCAPIITYAPPNAPPIPPPNAPPIPPPNAPPLYETQMLSSYKVYYLSP